MHFCNLQLYLTRNSAQVARSNESVLLQTRILRPTNLDKIEKVPPPIPPRSVSIGNSTKVRRFFIHFQKQFVYSANIYYLDIIIIIVNGSNAVWYVLYRDW